MDQLEFLTIRWGSDEYKQAIELRNRILRIPLGLKFSLADEQAEQDQLHFGAFRNETLIGSVSAVLLEKPAAKIRQMAVERECQSTGIGRFLMKRVEEELRQRGVKSVQLHARKSAVGFYHKLGYTVEGDEFLEVGIPHHLMTKRIAE